MKIKVTKMSYDKVANIEPEKHVKPVKQSSAFRHLMTFLSKIELKSVNFEYSAEGMDGINKDTPCLFLMNHSSFTDLEMAAVILRDRSYHIVCTNDGFVGKEKLMRTIGCIPAKKFINDVGLVKDMKYVVDKLKASVLMFPEASYSFDGTTTPLPDSIGKCIKFLNVPVVMIKTHGAFLRDPLYNCLQKRKAHVTAEVYTIIAKEDIKNKSVDELNEIVFSNFEYDHFREQKEKMISVPEAFRADGLERVLYKCRSCDSEGTMKGDGIKLTCNKCGASHEMTEYGELLSDKGEYSHIPDWYRWQRDCVRQEIENGSYSYSDDVKIMIYKDMETIYDVGDGHLTHTSDGFELTGCDGLLNYKQAPKMSYGLYSDYYWYEIGDMVCIGDAKERYYCFPQSEKGKNVAKLRLAAEEMYKMAMKKDQYA